MDRRIVEILLDVVGETINDQAIQLWLRGYDPRLLGRLDDAYDRVKEMLRENK